MGRGTKIYDLQEAEVYENVIMLCSKYNMNGPINANECVTYMSPAHYYVNIGMLLLLDP